MSPCNSQRKEYRAVIEKIEDITPDVRELTFRLQDTKCISLKPGQFILIKIMEGPLVFRAYSISSTPDECDILRLFLKIIFSSLQSLS